VSTREETLETVRELLELIDEALGLEADVEVVSDGDTVTGTQVGDDLGLFIGRHGQTIDAVQHLAQRIAFKGGPSDVRVVIDAAGYRERRATALRRQADDAADEAIRSDRPVALDAMVASERKLVHEHLRERGDVETYSEGAEPDRHLVVAPASADAAAPAAPAE
jgi:spoIIIJ-associated protein